MNQLFSGDECHIGMATFLMGLDSFDMTVSRAPFGGLSQRPVGEAIPVVTKACLFRILPRVQVHHLRQVHESLPF